MAKVPVSLAELLLHRTTQSTHVQGIAPAYSYNTYADISNSTRPQTKHSISRFSISNDSDSDTNHRSACKSGVVESAKSADIITTPGFKTASQSSSTLNSGLRPSKRVKSFVDDDRDDSYLFESKRKLPRLGTEKVEPTHFTNKVDSSLNFRANSAPSGFKAMNECKSIEVPRSLRYDLDEDSTAVMDELLLFEEAERPNCFPPVCAIEPLLLPGNEFIEESEVNKHLASRLKSYQREGVRWLWDKYCCRQGCILGYVVCIITAAH
jgi:hypothetical protein